MRLLVLQERHLNHDRVKAELADLVIIVLL